MLGKLVVKQAEIFVGGGGVVDWVVIHKLQLNLLKFFCRNFVKIVS